MVCWKTRSSKKPCQARSDLPIGYTQVSLPGERELGVILTKVEQATSAIMATSEFINIKRLIVPYMEVTTDITIQVTITARVTTDITMQVTTDISVRVTMGITVRVTMGITMRVTTDINVRVTMGITIRVITDITMRTLTVDAIVVTVATMENMDMAEPPLAVM